ncbi:MAG: hypothetical protein KatS3mg115_1311 [Candidatus Poribacteria bacterium]|nr:MAG: hypothetical protein KatS3mg115_1311 [Candidatus Poribacteria bacterium]
MNLLEDLNDAQRQAVLHTEGPVLILAGAGSGKTRALTYRIAYLIAEKGVSPFHILAVTFTNKAAQEMKERLYQLVGPRSRDIWARTFHSTCARILRKEIEALPPYDRNFTIFDTTDQLAAVKRVLLDAGVDATLKPQAVLATISRAKNEMLSPDQLAATASDYWTQLAAKLYDAYQKQLRSNNALDFDDLHVVNRPAV